MTIMRIPFSLYDAFAIRPFTGKVAGVVVTESELPVPLMHAMARELAAPTTGFVVASGARICSVRYFTPREEINTCGHVTVAVAVDLTRRGLWPVDEGPSAAFVAPTRAGDVPVNVRRSDGRLWVELTYAPRWVDDGEPLRLEIEAVLRVQTEAQSPIDVFATGLRHLVVRVDSTDALAGLQLDHAAIERLGGLAKIDTVCLFAMAAPSTLRMRDLTAPIGDIEEPASGTTASALATYAVRHGLMNAMRTVVIEQGVEMGRPSRIEVAVDAEAGVARVRGEAIPTINGTFVIEDDVAVSPDGVGFVAHDAGPSRLGMRATR
jgi:trans-2,3-dihydro-3-hydroxyanthranilate isomerase